MGMFDDLRCYYPLPIPGANKLVYQTKDLECFMDHYEIREDGTLWHEEYDIEDRSDPAEEGLMGLVGAMTRVNKRWKQVSLTGEVVFYGSFRGDWKDWIEWSSYFHAGRLCQLHLLRNDQPEAVPAVPNPSDNPLPSTRERETF